MQNKRLVHVKDNEVSSYFYCLTPVELVDYYPFLIDARTIKNIKEHERFKRRRPR